ncbi:hypothetical protein CEE39_03430 [bacterium (candidate division B38) B3_B38]|nr:MAG: hypothetical protein CEE39_03430 [bacterium (candidate division B38) B3_B38]
MRSTCRWLAFIFSLTSYSINLSPHFWVAKVTNKEHLLLPLYPGLIMRAGAMQFSLSKKMKKFYNM